MPRPGPRRPNTAVRLDEETTASLDRHAVRLGVNRSDIIREAIEQWLSDQDISIPVTGAVVFHEARKARRARRSDPHD